MSDGCLLRLICHDWCKVGPGEADTLVTCYSMGMQRAEDLLAQTA